MAILSGDIKSNEDLLGRAIQDAIKQEIERAVIAAVDAARDTIATRIPEIVAAVALRTMHHLSMERMGPDLLIRVDIKGLEGK